MLEALSREIRTDSPWELLGPDDQCLVQKLLVKVHGSQRWRKKAYVGTLATKILLAGINLDVMKESGKDP